MPGVSGEGGVPRACRGSAGSEGYHGHAGGQREARGTAGMPGGSGEGLLPRACRGSAGSDYYCEHAGADVGAYYCTYLAEDDFFRLWEAVG